MRIHLLVVAFALAGELPCLAADATVAGGTPAAPSSDEERVLSVAEHTERALRDAGLVYDNAALEAYLLSVAAGVAPPHTGAEQPFRFHVLREPTVNAFSLADGVVYLHAGLLARLDNEAQLAHVLAHEMAHTAARDQLAYLQSYRSAAVAKSILEFTAAFTLSLAAQEVFTGMIDSASSSALVGYSADQELEADRQALERIAAKGYSVEAVAELMTELSPKSEATVDDSKNEPEPTVSAASYLGKLAEERHARMMRQRNGGESKGSRRSSQAAQTHLANAQRAQYIRELIHSGQFAASSSESRHSARYLAATEQVAEESLRLALRSRRYSEVLAAAERALQRRGDRPAFHYYAAEAHRQIALHPENAPLEQSTKGKEWPDDALAESYRKRTDQEYELALQGYKRVLELDSNHAEAHRGLGFIAYELGERELAIRELTAYLAAESQPKDGRYIQKLLAELQP